MACAGFRRRFVAMIIDAIPSSILAGIPGVPMGLVVFAAGGAPARNLPAPVSIPACGPRLPGRRRTRRKQALHDLLADRAVVLVRERG